MTISGGNATLVVVYMEHYSLVEYALPRSVKHHLGVRKREVVDARTIAVCD